MTDVRRKRIPLVWSTVRERALAKDFSFNMGDAKCSRVSRRTKLSGRGVHSETVRGVGRGWVREEVVTQSELTVCSLFSLEPVVSEELEVEVFFGLFHCLTSS